MTRIRDKLALASERLRDAGAKIETRTDALIERLQTDLPKKVDGAFVAAEAVVGDYERGLGDLENDLKLLSNSDPLSGLENVSGVSDPTKPA